MSGADDPITIASLDVDDVQDAIANRGSDHHNSVSVETIVEKHRPRIREHGRRLGKRDTMLAKIGLSLGFIPFESQ